MRMLSRLTPNFGSTLLKKRVAVQWRLSWSRLESNWQPLRYDLDALDPSREADKDKSTEVCYSCGMVV